MASIKAYGVYDFSLHERLGRTMEAGGKWHAASGHPEGWRVVRDTDRTDPPGCGTFVQLKRSTGEVWLGTPGCALMKAIALNLGVVER